jgi:hypothetical protein
MITEKPIIVATETRNSDGFMMPLLFEILTDDTVTRFGLICRGMRRAYIMYIRIRVTDRLQIQEN